MIKVEGYRAFHGDMRITPKNEFFSPFYISDKDWLYKPDTDCWYGDGRSFPAASCEPIEEANYPNMSYTTVLGKDTLEHYIASFSPKRVDINGETVYDDGHNVRYSVQNYIDDMEGCMIPRKYYPLIEEVTIRVVDGCRHELEFKTKLEYRG